MGPGAAGHVALEVQRIENGEQTEIEGRYPTELAGLTGNLNTLIEQERARQTRYKDALDDLAHSLKTPLAVMRTALDEPAQLPAMVAQQVDRMDGIVQHQLGRAAASGAARFAPHLALAPVLHRIRDSLTKVYADKGLGFTVECPPHLSWRIDEGDAFEILGNILDNAAKWARHRVEARIWRDGGRLFIRIQDDGPGFSDAAGRTAAPRAAGRTGARPRDRSGGGQRSGCQPSGRVEAFARGLGRRTARYCLARRLTVMPGLTRHPRFGSARQTWIAGQARNNPSEASRACASQAA